jgi:isoleucyl-tRNA synthetase
VPVKDSLLLDQWAVQQAYDTQQVVIGAYARYDFPEIVQRVQNFCTNEMGALYLDITKDPPVHDAGEQPGAAQRAERDVPHLEALVRWLAPILSFTAEEIWQFMPQKTPAGAAWRIGAVRNRGTTASMRCRVRPSTQVLERSAGNAAAARRNCWKACATPDRSAPRSKPTFRSTPIPD